MQKTIALSAILFMALFTTFFTACNNNNTSEPVANSTEDSLQKVVVRGKYLALHVAACIHCHSTRDFNKYAGPTIPGSQGGGGAKFDHSILDAIPGTIYSKNITPDSATGIGTWTDGEILRAITQGINKKGDTLFPLMPYAHFNRMSKDDLLSIIAYLRTLKPIKNIIPERQLMIPISMAYPAPALQKSVDGNIRPPEYDQVKYGAYLVSMAGCSDCHTPYVKGQPDFSHEFAGGNTFTLGNIKVTSANITPDSTTGIGRWDVDAFMNKFTVCREEKGYNYDPGKMNTVMPIVDYAGMKDGDLKAIYAYLRTVKPVKNIIVKYPR
jgi:mono/diheme cytochrome c family protein